VFIGKVEMKVRSARRRESFGEERFGVMKLE
jgi:hypothetical protein